jgi:hypothetical protein
MGCLQIGALLGFGEIRVAVLADVAWQESGGDCVDE